ncbi:uncharacterized protein LOC144349708 [Saccoglossus kowalevskii]
MLLQSRAPLYLVIFICTGIYLAPKLQSCVSSSLNTLDASRKPADREGVQQASNNLLIDNTIIDSAPNIKISSAIGDTHRITSVVMPHYIHSMFDGLKTEDGTNLLKICRMILRHYTSVTLQFLTAGYLEMTKSWICNIECFDVVSRVLFVTTDSNVYSELHKFNVTNVILLHFKTLPSFSFGQVAYWKYMVYRTGIVHFLLQNDIPVFITESDAVWFHDAHPAMVDKYNNIDIVAARNSDNDSTLCGGMVYLNSTTTVKQIWNKTFEGMEDSIMKYVSKNDDEFIGNVKHVNDLQQFNKAVRESTNLNIEILSRAAFGSWSSSHPGPGRIVSQNNWVTGNAAKIERAKKAGFWFVTDDGLSCLNNSCVKLENK